MKRLIPSGLRAQISAVVVAPAIAIAILGSLASLWTLHRISEDMTVEALHRATQRTEMSMQAAEQAMHSVAQALAASPALAAAAAARDGAALRALLLPAYADLSEGDPRISSVEVGGADGRVLLRAHNPDRAGDDKSATRDVREALAGRPSVGMTVSPTTGVVYYGATVPLRQGGQVVGTLRVSGQLDDGTASIIAASSGGEAMLVVRGAVKASTLHGVTPELLAALLSDDSAARGADGLLVEVPAAGPYLMRTLPITNLEGHAVGAIILGLSKLNWNEAERWGTLTTLAVALLGLLVAMPLALLLAGRLAAAIKRIASAMSAIAMGDLTQTIPGLGRRDEVGAMASALEVFNQELQERQRLQHEAETARQQRERRAAAMEHYTQDFGQSIAGVMRQLEEASTGMKDAALRMTAAVGETQERASGTASDAAQASESLTAVAAAVEEMAASVGEISRQVARAATIATEAVSEAAASDERMQSLTRSADRIGDILGVISDVAGRTNLLALNATIEAARAGEAGKGFAVVASEVKQLAAQTARATEDVGEQIQAMRLAANEAAGAMRGMTQTIARIDEVATTIAAAVEEQGSATREITGRLQLVATSTNGVSEAMGNVLTVAGEAGRVSGNVQRAAADVGSQAATLRQEVEGFLNNLRGDPKELRQFERRRVSGQKALVDISGKMTEMPIIDVSFGGTALRCSLALGTGSSLRVTLPGAPAVLARVVRCGGGVLAVVFCEPDSMDAVMKAVEKLTLQPA